VAQRRAVLVPTVSSTCHSRRMARAVIPAWVVPAEHQVIDCHRLAAAGRDVACAFGSRDGSFEAGVAAAVSWVVGTGRSPITDRELLPTPQAVQEEFLAAGEVELERSPRCAVVPLEAGQAVRRTLAWLLGWEHRPPVPLPRRPVPSAEQLFEEARAATLRPWLPEERDAAWLAALREADRLVRLAARADSLAA
jgi:hypothetical protein